MGWVKDKGGSAVKKEGGAFDVGSRLYEKGGTVKKQWESKKESLKTKRLAQELAAETIMSGKKPKKSELKDAYNLKKMKVSSINRLRKKQPSKKK